MTLDHSTGARRDAIEATTRDAVDAIFATDAGHALIAIDNATTDPADGFREWELDAEGRRTWEAGYMVGFAAAAPELMAEITALRAQLEQANRDADRYYAEMSRRPAPAERTATRATFTEVSRARGDHDRAARHEQQIDRMFPQYANTAR